MIPADDMPPTNDHLDRINAELAQEAEERRVQEADEEIEGVIKFRPRPDLPRLYDAAGLPTEPPGVYDDAEADLLGEVSEYPRPECRQRHLPGEG